MANFNYLDFVKIPTATDRILSIKDKNNIIVYKLNPFMVDNVLVQNNNIKVNFTNSDYVLIDFNNNAESRIAIKTLESNLEILRNKVPYNIDKQTELYVNQLIGSISAHYSEVTYSELISTIDSGSLNPGSYYSITDFKTCYDQPNYNVYGNAITQGNYKVGNTHSILVFATSETTLSTDAWQPDFSNDIIKYDVSYSTTYTTGGTAFGRITERIDEWNNRTDYDHRDILFKRYRHYYADLMPLSGTIDMIESGTVSGIDTQFDVDFSVDDYLFLSDNLGLVYKITQISSSQSMSVTGSYITASNSINYYKGYRTSENNLDGYLQYYQNNVDGAEDYLEFHTFKFGDEDILNNKFGDFYSLRNWNEPYFDLPNNVFGEDVLSSIFGASFENNTFVNDVEETKIGDYCQNNIYYSDEDENDFDDNVIGNFFQNNTILSRFDRNSIKNSFENNYIIAVFQNNFIGDNFSDNRININNDENNFDNNNIGNNFNNNNIYEKFYQNRIFNDFNNNNLYNSFYKNEIGCQFDENTIGDFEDIGAAEFYQNKIGNIVKGNLFIGQNYGNEYGENFTSNELLSTYSNKFGYECIENTLGENFSNNIIGNHFGLPINGNTVGNYFQYNNISNNFNSNTIGINFAYNIIGNNFENNTIGDDFGFGGGESRGNKIGNYFTNNTIGEYFYDNTVTDVFYGCTVGNYFQLNDIKIQNVDYDFTTNLHKIVTIAFSATGSSAIDGTYSNIPGATTTSINGTNSTFDILVNSGIVTSVSISNPGKFYEDNDDIIILGTQIGGTDGTDNIEIRVTDIYTPAAYENYNCDIFKRKDGEYRLSYYDEDDILTIKDIDE
jgi:hypothetical protein